MVGGVILQQLLVMLEMRTAAGGVRYDRVELIGRKLVDLLSGQPLGEFPFAVVCVQGTAAKLLGGSDDFTAVARQDLNRVAVDIAENQILGATGQNCDPILS